jgi:hypothetical protein
MPVTMILLNYRYPITSVRLTTNEGFQRPSKGKFSFHRGGAQGGAHAFVRAQVVVPIAQASAVINDTYQLYCRHSQHRYPDQAIVQVEASDRLLTDDLRVRNVLGC